MITIQKNGNLVSVAIFGEFTLADYKEFESQVLFKYHFKGKGNLLLDWREMLSYTIDVAWEEIKFIREHASEFKKVAVITDNQWQSWSAWVSNLFIDADIRVFTDLAEANAWLQN